MTDLERIKKDVVEMDSRANVCWYDTKVLTKAVRLILEELTADRKTENSSEKPNNCEHITEDGVTCAKYPACDDCLDNPLNKVKGSERFVKGSEQTEPTISKMEQVDKDINVRSKDEPQTCSFSDCDNFKNPDYERCIECKRKQIKLKTEQTERSE